MKQTFSRCTVHHWNKNKNKPGKTKGTQTKSVKRGEAKLQEGSQIGERRKRLIILSHTKKGKLEEVGVQI